MKRTLYFGNPAYLKIANNQLSIKIVESGETKIAAIEDIGTIVLDNQQITITQATITKLIENNVALIICDKLHHPSSLLLNLDGHSLQSQKFKWQIEAALPLKKQLWQQTIESKLLNQAQVLKEMNSDHKYLTNLAKCVKSGDSGNCEAKGAAYYWKNLFPKQMKFSRNSLGIPPNNLLNYGYAILRATVARNLVGAGLLPTLGIFHRNQYNAYCLADDIMEPYRPFVDRIVRELVIDTQNNLEVTGDNKKALLSLPSVEVQMEGYNTSLMNAIQTTAFSLATCFAGETKKILYPYLN